MCTIIAQQLRVCLFVFLTAAVAGRELYLVPGHRPGTAPALFDCLLWAQVVGMATLLEAVDCTEMQACIARAADHLVIVVLLGKLMKGGSMMPLRRRGTRCRRKVDSFRCWTGCGHPPAVRRRVSVSADQVGCLPCLGLGILYSVTGLNLRSDGLHEDLDVGILLVSAAQPPC